jgi:hypothetical protein
VYFSYFLKSFIYVHNIIKIYPIILLKVFIGLKMKFEIFIKKNLFNPTFNILYLYYFKFQLILSFLFSNSFLFCKFIIILSFFYFLFSNDTFFYKSYSKWFIFIFQKYFRISQNFILNGNLNSTRVLTQLVNICQKC